MRRRILVAPLSMILSGIVVGTCWAQDPPVVLDHYRLLPRLSVLHQTGGIAGVDWRYRLIGKYDLQHEIGWGAKASFENAEIWGSLISPDPTPAVVLDVDQVLNLEGLEGEALPLGAPFDVYQFQGFMGDGSSVHLLGAVIGPWMYIRGGTQPPAGSADFFEFQIRAVARSRPFADFNDDGKVDAADYVLLRKSPAAGADVATHADWSQQFGEQVPDFGAYDAILGTALGSLGPAAVPESVSAVLLLVGGFMLSSCRRR